MKTLIHLKIQTILSYQNKIINKATLLLIILFFIQTTQAKTTLTGKFLINNNLSSTSLELKENNLYNSKSEKEGGVISISNDSINTSKNSTFREVANVYLNRIEEGNNATQFYYILKQNFKNAISLENIAVANQPFPNPDTDNDGITDDIDLDDDNDGTLDVLEDQVPCNVGYLSYEFYSENPSENTVDNIPTTGAIATGTINNFNLSALQSSVGDSGSFSVRYTGHISLPTNGLYTFFTKSDDGSKLFIDGVEIVDNDGIHGQEERSGSVTLEEGVYPITILFFQGGGGFSLSASYAGPLITKTDLPFNILYSQYCTLDTDEDGIPNSLDLDSDNDGCLDTKEAGAIDDGTTTDINNNGLLDQYEDGTTGTISYESTYSAYAVDNTINVCLDSDNDGVADVLDLDDDNDGILDAVEALDFCNNGGVLNFEFYATSPSGNTVDNIPTTGAIATGTIENFNVSALQSSVGDTGSFAVRYTGYISITTNGTYTFFTSSDDGSKLLIDGVEIVNNDGSHGTIERSGTVTLDAGVYPITVLFYQGGGGFNLSASYAGPSISKTSLPFNILTPQFVYCAIDTDGDGIPDRLDLDSDGDGCPDAIEGTAAFTNSDLVNSSMPGGNIGGFYTGQYNSPVIQNLGTTVDGDGIPIVASSGQGIGTAIIANPVLDETANQTLAVSDVTYTAGNAVFTITNALANITYELVDQSENSLSPQVIATQGASTSDLDLTLLQANVPTGDPSTTYQVIAGIFGACRITLADQPTLTLSATDSDGDGVADATDLDDDNDGILDIVEDFSIEAALWLDASDSSTITEIDGLVSQWNDKSANNRHVLEFSIENNPVTNSKTINNLNVIDFVSSDVLQTTDIATWLNSTKYHFIAVLNHDAEGYYAGTSSGSGSNRTLHMGQNGNQWHHQQFGGDYSYSAPHELDTSPIIAVNSMNNPGAELFINGTSIGSSNNTPTSFDTDGKFSIGMPTTIGNLGSYDGTIAEVICVTGELSSVVRQRIEGYLAHKWGLTARLPENHPYKT
ncbi:PA14 domain-containing protein, partial [Flavobacteriaceae bacterium]|nr:PA14 domain-containing protein [Flavobacteriaceae bacterium]